VSGGFPADPKEFCVTDVGSTTTKAILFHRDGSVWGFHRREAPTTVEKPQEDVTVGVVEALAALEAETGRALLRDGAPAVPYLSTSSAGGGLAVVVTGLVGEVTSRSAARCALGAGAILLDVIAMDDGRTPYEKIEALKRLRPDLVLLAGGFDGDAITGPVFLAELVREAGLRPKLSRTAALPVIYAGNQRAREYAEETLGERFLFHPVPNIRPASDRENLEPAREAIQELFLNHVMSHAPGYDRLLQWVGSPVRPTPAAFGRILALASRTMPGRILAVDIGGATTDVFTAEKGVVFRTVSANLGMSYSILHVARGKGFAAIQELLGGRFTDAEVWDAIGNKHLHPTRLPATEADLRIEEAVAAVAVREAVKDHLQVLRGVSLSRGKEELRIRGWGAEPAKKRVAEGPFALDGYQLVIGSGGVLSHTAREAAAWMLVNALRPGRRTELAVDSAFIFPHLGVLSESAPELALQLFRELGCVPLERPADRARSRPAPSGSEETPRSSASDGEAPRASRVRRGELREARELAIPGTVLVAPEQPIWADTVIARSSQRFLRPFFIDLAGALGIEPREVAADVLRQVGDEIAPGDVIARHKANVMITMEFRAPIAGTIDRILPSGMLVVRERPEDAVQRTVVQVARDLRLPPDRTRPWVRVKVGQSIDRDQWLAAAGRPAEMRVSKSPVRGRIRHIDFDYGVITIEPLRDELEVRAWLPGRVETITDRGAIVVCEGTEIEGIWGRGGEASGTLRRNDAQAGEITVLSAVTREDLARLVEAGAAGLIAGSAHLKDLQEADPAFTIVLTEGFGDRTMRPEIADLLQAHAGRLALLDGRTEMRVGVRRPRVLLPS
jgi:uncharacterized protein (TIGR01319 family)